MRSKRGKLEVYSDILRAVASDGEKYGKARFTRVQALANLPHDRFKEYLGKLEENDFVRITRVPDQIDIELTVKGTAYLERYREVLSFLGAFGFGE